jgi:hypothetical protein
MARSGSGELGFDKLPPIISIPMSRISMIQLAPHSEDSLSMDYSQASRGVELKKDIVELKNRDQIMGTFVGWSKNNKGVLFLVDGKEINLDVDRIARIRMNPELGARRPPTSAYYHMILQDGSRINLSEWTVQQNRLNGKMLFKTPIEIPFSEVIKIQTFQGKATYLSDLIPSSYEYTPYLEETYPWRADRNVLKHPLRLSGDFGISNYDKGLGLHSQSKLVYQLKREYGQLLGLAGLDAIDGKKGSAALKISRDGKPVLFEKRETLILEEKTTSLQIDLRDVKELSIEVLWGKGGFIGDVVNLADIRLTQIK